MMTSTKALAGAASGPLVLIASWLVTLIPHWMMVPPDVQHAVFVLVTMGIPALLVYHAPANKQTVDPPAP